MSIWQQILSNGAIFQPRDNEAFGPPSEDDPLLSDLPKPRPAPKDDNQQSIGREEEIAAFDAYLDRAERSQGSLLLFTGEEGSGKTYLLKKIRDQATKRSIPAFY